MIRRPLASFIVTLALAATQAFLLTGCERIYTSIFGPSKDVVNAKAAFLAQNPKLDVILAQLRNEHNVQEANISELKKIRRSFAQEGSKMMVEQKIADYTASIQGLKAQINRIEEEVERGVALQTFNQMDGGGLAASDMQTLIQQSMSVLNTAERQRAIASGVYRQGATNMKSPTSQVGVASVPASTQSVTPIVPSQKKPPNSTNSAVIPKAGIVDPAPDKSFRIWRVLNGKSVKARMLSVNSNNVILECEDGTAFAQPIHLLVPEDRLLLNAPVPSKNVPDPALTEQNKFVAQKTTDGYLNIRSGPGLQNQVVGRIRSGSRGIMQVGPTIHDAKDDIIWMPVRFGGVSGFVSSNFLKPE
jgi:hypothetical protein